MEDNEKILYESMRNNTPVLLLGAGYSLGSRNNDDKDLELASKLGEILYEHFFTSKKYKSITDEDIEAANQCKTDLKMICTLLKTLELKSERDDFLTRYFKGCKPKPENHYHEKFTRYKWNKIFTLNIDDLLENIYAMQDLKYDVIDSGTADPGRDDAIRPKIIKLHGNVANPEFGYVFDSDEYTNFTAEQSPMLRLFGQYFSSNDVIILGSEFQENDLSIINALYQSAGSISAHNYFFVSPKIGDYNLKRKIDKTPNFYHLPWTTEIFIENISSNVVPYIADNHDLQELGVVFPGDSFRNNPEYLSEIYKGSIPRYEDFLSTPSWDIEYPGLSTKIFSEIGKGKDLIIPLYGNQYCGKTCQLMRLLVEAKKRGFLSFELKVCLPRNLYEVKGYLQTLPDNQKVAIACDWASSSYKILVDFIREKPSNVSQLVIFTADTKENHFGKRHYLKEAGFNKEYKISEQLNYKYAENIFKKLDEHTRLGSYQSLIPTGTTAKDVINRTKIINKILEFNDIIDALYYAYKGEKFKDYYRRFVNTHCNDKYWKHICLLSMLDSIGLSKIPISFVDKLLPLCPDFCFNTFVNTYDDFVQIERGYIHIRGSQIILKFINIDNALFEEALYQLVLQTINLFSENKKNEFSDIYEKSLRIKRIYSSGFLDINGMFSLLSRLEPTDASQYSYFWIQYGIAAQKKNQYDDANNHFLKAQTIRNSYSVRHALALNQMEKGVYQQKHKNNGAEEIFLQGQREMEELIITLNSPRTYRYSVHSYVNMLMQYYHQKGTVIPDETLGKIRDYINIVLQSPLDSWMNCKIRDFISYCNVNGKTQYCRFEKARRKVSINLTEEDYEEAVGSI